LAETVGPIDILINNAGVVREHPALHHPEADWEAVVDTNLKGMFYVAQALAPAMRERGRGTIINIASILGLRQAGEVISYAVSKGWRDPAHEDARVGMGSLWHSCQCGGAGTSLHAHRVQKF